MNLTASRFSPSRVTGRCDPAVVAIGLESYPDFAKLVSFHFFFPSNSKHLKVQTVET
jgi:hypothetical protein